MFSTNAANGGCFASTIRVSATPKKMINGFPIWIIAWQISPRTACSDKIETSIKNFTLLVFAWSPKTLWRRQTFFEILPLSVGKVGTIFLYAPIQLTRLNGDFSAPTLSSSLTKQLCFSYHTISQMKQLLHTQNRAWYHAFSFHHKFKGSRLRLRRAAKNESLVFRFRFFAFARRLIFR